MKKVGDYTNEELALALELGASSITNGPEFFYRAVCEAVRRLRPTQYKEIYEINGKISAIKAYRDDYCVALKDAKDAIEAMAADGHWVKTTL